MNGTYTLEVLNAETLATLDAEEWDALSTSALEANPYYARAYVLAGLATVDAQAGVQALSIRRNGMLAGLFPFRVKKWPLKRAVAAANHYQPSGQPLIHRAYAGGVVKAWLNAIRGGKIPRRWTFRNIDLSSPFLTLCREHDNDNAFETVPTGSYRRARLDRRPENFEAHLETVVSKRRVKDIRRTIRRLQELGDLTFERVHEPDAVAQRIEDFLAIEHGGWKGKTGTSFLAHPADAEFARKAFVSNGALKASVDSLLLNGQPIAVSINLQSGDTIFTPKCAYDEAYRKHSPGLVLEYLIVEAFYASEEGVQMDSSTTVDGHVVQGLWNNEVQMGSVVIGPKGLGTNVLASAQRAKAFLRAWLKSMLTSPKEAGPVSALRRLVRRFKTAQTNTVIYAASFPHAADHLLHWI